MNVFRVKRKGKKDNYNIRIWYISFWMIMTTLAWFAFSKTLDIKWDLHVNAWNVKFYEKVGNGPNDYNLLTDNELEISLEELYPQMPQATWEIKIENIGEVDANVEYTLSDVILLGQSYEVVEKWRDATTEYYIVLGNITTEDEKLRRDLFGMDSKSKYNFNEEQINDFPVPLNIILKYSPVVKQQSSDTLQLLLSWDSTLGDQTDTNWGYKIAKYVEKFKADHPGSLVDSYLNMKLSFDVYQRIDLEKNYVNETTELTP